MRRGLIVGALALTLSACTELTAPMGGFQPQYDSWKATVAKTGIDTKQTVWLGGSELNGITTRAEAEALVATNRGKQGSMVGYIHQVRVSGNRAAIEIIPVFSAESAMRCTGRSNNAPLACLEQKKAVWRSSVTCHVNDYAALKRRLGEDLEVNSAERWQRRSAWAHVLVAGTISRVDRRQVAQAKSFSADGSFDGILGGAYLEGFAYSNIHLNSCRVATYRSKLVSQS